MAFKLLYNSENKTEEVMNKILILGKDSRLNDEIQHYLKTNSYEIVSLFPNEDNLSQIENIDFTNCVVLHEFPVFRNYETLERIMRLSCSKVIFITSDYSLRFKREIAKCQKAEVIYRPFLPKQLITSLTQNKH